MPHKQIGEYPPNWQEIARATKDEAGWCCVRCGHPHDPPSGRMLTTHHLDGDKSNCEWWNLAALCQACHLRIQAKVIINQPWMFEHSDWFKPYVAGYYAHLWGLPEDRIYVMDNIDQLLDMGRVTMAPINRKDGAA